MKIGRNEKCFCGSGKKYKNCCIDKPLPQMDFPFEFAQDFSEDAPTNVDKSLLKKFLPIFAKYKFLDLARAVFCINAWRGNRPELQFYLTLNSAIVDCKKEGTAPISNYKEFSDFFGELKKLYKHTAFVDENVPDFGEVRIAYNKKFYPIFVGFGSNRVYSLMQLVEPLARLTGKVQEFECVWVYLKRMIETLKPTNPHDVEKSFGDLYLPSQGFFEACVGYYEAIAERDMSAAIKEFLVKDAYKIENKHFLRHDKAYFPLFNPSILMDAYHNMEKNLSEAKRTELANFALYSAIMNNFGGDSEMQTVFLDVGVIVDLVKNAPLSNKTCSILILEDDGAMLLIDESSFELKELHSYIDKIKSLHSAGTLKFASLTKERKLAVAPIPSDFELVVIA